MKNILIFAVRLTISALFIFSAQLAYLPKIDDLYTFTVKSLFGLIILGLPIYHLLRKNLSKNDFEEMVGNITLAYFITPALIFALFYFISLVANLFPNGLIYISTTITVAWAILLTIIFHEIISLKAWLLITTYSLASGLGWQTGVSQCQKTANAALLLGLLIFMLILLVSTYRFVKDNKQFIKI